MADDCGFKINKAYAERYNKWREKEELQKLKDKYGDLDPDEASDSSSSETEDEDAEALTSSVQRDWLRALAAIKSKDPKIYDPNITFYKEPDDSSNSSSEKPVKQKPMFLKDYDRKIILEKGGVLSSESDEEEDEQRRQIQSDPSYFEEQENIKQSIKAALPDSDSDDEILVRREKSKEEQEREESEYLEWLKGQKPELTTEKQVGVELKPLKSYWQDPKLGADERFLRDYILNQQFLEEDEDRIPTYNEIVDEDVSDEDQEIEKQEEFERKYNFRFEEPDPEFIKSYPRTMGDSLRRKKEKRAKKRAEVKERKQKEKEKKMEELKQLKNLKKKEILSRIDRLKETSGDPNLELSEHDIEKDFDPQEHDRMMEQMFNEDYYDNNDEDETKPVFSDDEELDIEKPWDNWQGQSVENDAEGQSENDGEEMEEDTEENVNSSDGSADDGYDKEDLSFGLDGRSKKKRKSKFAQALERRKPLFNPDEKTFEEYFDEYYKLDYEDIIGDQPCRFKYRQVPANDFGLSTNEVMSCPDRELNAWVSLRKMSQYRTEEEEVFERRDYLRRSKNVLKKQRILPSLAESSQAGEPEEEEPHPKKKRRRKRKKGRADVEGTDGGSFPRDGSRGDQQRINGVKSSTGSDNASMTSSGAGKAGPDKKRKKKRNSGDATPTISAVTHGDKTVSKVKSAKDKRDADLVSKKKKRDRKKKALGTPSQGFHVSSERLKAYGINPKKFRYSNITKLDPAESKVS